MAYKRWSKEDLQTLERMWDNSTIQEIADVLKMKKKQVVQMAYNIRQNYPGRLISKRIGYESLIDEVFGSKR